MARGCVLTSEEARERYSRDESTRVRFVPDAVVLPVDEEEVRTVLAWANAGRYPVVTRGAGTGVAGGAVAVGGGVVLSLENMNRILEIDAENLTLTTEPGVVTGDLQREAERRGLFYPPDPASSDNCTIGGNIAVGAGGARAVKYGTTRNYVLGLKVATADGRLLVFGGKNVKDATGYRLIDLMVGSEGTLGVITEATLRLIPLPPRNATILVPFPSVGGAVEFVTRLLKSRLVPAVAEFMDEVAIEAARAHLGRDLPSGSGAGAYAFISFDGEGEEELLQRLSRAENIARGMDAKEVYAALDQGQQARLWEARRTLGDAMKGLSPVIGKADVVVPRASVPGLVAEVKGISADLGLRIACFGHAGDGNVHVNILREKLSDDAWEKTLETSMGRVMETVLRLGGKPSGEHGIGVLKKAELRAFLGEDAVRLMCMVKDVFDPEGILNPGKVL